MNAMSRPCPERELLLHGLADGELDAANALAMEEHLQNCGECALAYDEILNEKKYLKGESLRFRAPQALRERILAGMPAEDGSAVETAPLKSAFAPARVRQSTVRRIPLAYAGPAFSAMALAASLLLFVNSSNQMPRPDAELVAGHVRSLLVSHLTDVASSDQHTVKPWFLGKLDFAPPVIDLAKKDFPLIGGRLDYLSGRVVPALVYKRHSHVINLYIWPSGKLQEGRANLEGYNIIRWTKSGFSFAAVSDLNLPELQEFHLDFEEELS